jgi:hypothetical protein
MVRIVVLLFAFTFAVTFARRASAHDTDAAQIDVALLSDHVARISVLAPPGARIEIPAPVGCRVDRESAKTSTLRCREDVRGLDLDVDGLGQGTADVAFVRIEAATGDAVDTTIVTAHAPRFTVPGAKPSRGVVGRFVRLGAEHVLSGVDHLLFLFALYWLARAHAGGSTRTMIAELARTATAFTIAHSLTLTATVLGALRVPPAAAEAAVAWSLVLVALDVGRESVKRSAIARASLAGAFGLVHGLGFAGALAETKLPEGARFVALLSFNIGVECGQLIALGACAVAVSLALRFFRGSAASDKVALGSAYAVGVTGAAMFFLRLGSVLRW